MDQRDDKPNFAENLRDQIHQDIHDRIHERMSEKMNRPRVMLAGDFHWGFIWGAVIALIGTLLLLNRMGVLPFDPLSRYWPLVLILFGVMNLLNQSGRFFGILLIIAGTALQLSKLGIVHLSFADLWPLAIIAVGLLLMWGSIESRSVLRGQKLKDFRDRVRQATDATADSATTLNAVAVFGGCERRITGQNFLGGKVTAVFGGVELDLRDATMEADTVIEINCIFGGVEIRVPETWHVHSRSLPIFGGYEDKTRQVVIDPSAPRKTLIITGMVVFGGVEIKN